jgi:hypothetical protein
LAVVILEHVIFVIKYLISLYFDEIPEHMVYESNERKHLIQKLKEEHAQAKKNQRQKEAMQK